MCAIACTANRRITRSYILCAGKSLLQEAGKLGAGLPNCTKMWHSNALQRVQEHDHKPGKGQEKHSDMPINRECECHDTYQQEHTTKHIEYKAREKMGEQSDIPIDTLNEFTRSIHLSR